MSLNLTILSTIVCTAVLVFVIALVVRKQIKIKYALVWIILFTLLLIAILVPGFLNWLTEISGFQIASNLVICLFLAVLVIISIVTTVIVSRQNRTIRTLIQEIAILKEGRKNK